MAFFETALGGALLDGGLSLIKGIFGGRSAKKQRAQALRDQALQFVRLRDAAEAGGFNPLTVLGANPDGGMVNPTPALASGEFVADALGSATQTYFNGKDRERDIERDALEKALMREELAQMQSQSRAVTSAMGFGYAIPQSNNYTGVEDAKVPSLSSGDYDPNRTDGLLERRLPISQGLSWAVDTNLPPAQAVETEYGDIAQNVYGVGKIAWDVGNNIGRVVRRFTNYAGSGALSQPVRPRARPNTNTNFNTARHAGPLARFR